MSLGQDTTSKASYPKQTTIEPASDLAYNHLINQSIRLKMPQAQHKRVQAQLFFTAKQSFIFICLLL